jgi:hypothetical protein
MIQFWRHDPVTFNKTQALEIFLQKAFPGGNWEVGDLPKSGKTIEVMHSHANNENNGHGFSTYFPLKLTGQGLYCITVSLAGLRRIAFHLLGYSLFGGYANNIVASEQNCTETPFRIAIHFLGILENYVHELVPAYEFSNQCSAIFKEQNRFRV